MTILDANMKLYEWFTDHDSVVIDRDFQQIILISDNSEEDKACFIAALKDLDLSTTELKIPHGLGRRPSGFIVLTRDAAQVIYESSTSDVTFINLKAGGAVTADVWVF